MNFTTHALENLENLRKEFIGLHRKRDAMVVESMMVDLIHAKKFLLPPPDRLNVTADLKSMQFMRLPYQCCVFEYEVPCARDESASIQGLQLSSAKSSRRIALCYDGRLTGGPVGMLKRAGKLPHDADGILVMSIYYVDSNKCWIPALGAAYIDAKVAAGMPDMRFDNSKLVSLLWAFPLMAETLAVAYPDFDNEQYKTVIINDTGEEMGSAVRACLLLNAKNLKAVKVCDAPEALNKKRTNKKNGKSKPPFFEYYTLDLFFAQTRPERKRLDFGAMREHFKNVMSILRLGSVRGHMKTRKTGVFWWNDHQRGNAANGVVEKDYKVHTEV